MSYILDALKKLEEKDARQGGGRLSGGGRPVRSGRRAAFAVAVILVAAAAAVLALRREGVEPLPGNPAATAEHEAVGGGAQPAPPQGGAREYAAEVRNEAKRSATGTEAETVTGPADAREAPAPPAGVPLPEETVFGVPAAEEISLQEVFGGRDGEEGALTPPTADGQDQAALFDGDAGAPFADVGAVFPPEEGKGALTGPVAGRLYDLHELPGVIRDELGDLVMTGHIFSDDPSFRVVMVGDRVMKEGDTVSPGLVLKEITGDGARFAYRGYVFLVKAL